MIIYRPLVASPFVLKDMKQKTFHKKSDKRLQTSSQRKPASLKRGKRAPTPYNLYFREQCEIEKKKNPEIQFVELSAQIARRWKALSEVARREYCERTKEWYSYLLE